MRHIRMIELKDTTNLKKNGIKKILIGPVKLSGLSSKKPMVL